MIFRRVEEERIHAETNVSWKRRYALQLASKSFLEDKSD